MTPSSFLAKRYGTFVPFVAVCCVVMFTFVALAIDVGMMMVARSQCQNAADAAALAGARVLDNRFPANSNPDSYDNRRTDAEETARQVVRSNHFFNERFANSRIRVVRTGLYDYDPVRERFGAYFPGVKPTGKSWAAMEVEVDGEQPAYFASVIGVSRLPGSARAVAAHRPRDLSIVLDMSGSMQFSSYPHWEPGTAGSIDAVYGLLNPDPNYPKAGHYERYGSYQTTDPRRELTFSSSPSSRPNPLCMRANFLAGTGEVFAPNNHTIETPNGPALIHDFYLEPGNLPFPHIPASVVFSANSLRPAFHRWSPPIISAGNPNTLTPPTYNWAGYNAFDISGTSGPVPAPPSFADQSDAVGVPYVGDRFPRKGGFTYAGILSWDPSSLLGAAKNAVELLHPMTSTPSPLPRGIPLSRTVRAGANRVEGGTDWGNFYDEAWERYGYDLDVYNYNGYSSASTGEGVRMLTPLRTTNLFKGYSMGPGYWGKTFFMWPPDPRWGNPNGGNPIGGLARPDAPNYGNPVKDNFGNWLCDWRRRFFIQGTSPTTGSPTAYVYFNPQGDNDPTLAGEQSINRALLNPIAGHVLRDPGTIIARRYRVNYRAVLAWLKTGPQVLPPNLRAGRVLYYTSIPDHVDDAATNPDQRFWREYIDYVLGYTGNNSNYDPRYTLAGTEGNVWPEGSPMQLGTTSNFDPDAAGPMLPNPRPYMNYSDQPNRPRMHFWFGPATMLMFLSTRQPIKNWLPGTARESQSWQLKSGVQSAIEDIRYNHPNDQVGLVFFGYPNYSTPAVQLGQDWITLKNSLFFPKTLLPEIKAGNQSVEIRPYNSGFGSSLAGVLPNANGQTDPNTGMALAFNMLRGPAQGGNGRKGALKMVIFETDGVPNSFYNFLLNGSGPNTYYSFDGTGGNRGNGHSDVMNAATDISKQMMKLTSDGGHSLPSATARTYPIAFGDLFSSSSTFRPTALNFLEKLANPDLPPTVPPPPLPATQIITGPAQTRISNLRTAFERILQSGVQVTLVE